MQPAPPFIEDHLDQFCWLGHPTGSFTVASAWEGIRHRGGVVQWHRFVWDKTLAPRHSFLLWLASLNRLPTQTLLMQYRRIPGGTCVFCRSRPDSIDHLFFGCGITRRLASKWATNCHLGWQNRPWHAFLRWANDHLCGGSFSQQMARFSLGALCYVIWKERNDILFRGKVLFLPAMMKHLEKLIKDKALSFGNIEDNPVNRRMQRNWGIAPSIFSGSG